MDFVNKLCFKITFRCFFFSFKLQLQQPKLKEVFALHSIVFLLFHLKITRVVSTELLSCEIYIMFVIIYFGNLGYSFSLVIPKL